MSGHIDTPMDHADFAAQVDAAIDAKMAAGTADGLKSAVAGYSGITNAIASRGGFDADTITHNQLVDVVATLIGDLVTAKAIKA